MTNHHLFINKTQHSSTLSDCLVAIFVGLALAVGALAYFDILTP